MYSFIKAMYHVSHHNNGKIVLRCASGSTLFSRFNFIASLEEFSAYGSIFLSERHRKLIEVLNVEKWSHGTPIIYGHMLSLICSWEFITSNIFIPQSLHISVHYSRTTRFPRWVSGSYSIYTWKLLVNTLRFSLGSIYLENAVHFSRQIYKIYNLGYSELSRQNNFTHKGRSYFSMLFIRKWVIFITDRRNWCSSIQWKFIIIFAGK